jgi:type III pantothenate kinase
MTPDVVVDIGNSRMKWAFGPPGNRLDLPNRMASLAPDSLQIWEEQLEQWGMVDSLKWAVASVHTDRLRQFVVWAEDRGDQVQVIDHSHVPIVMDVEEPSKVGIDRLLNVLAFKRWSAPGVPGIVVDVGSAVTADFIDEHGTFRGGAILPGPWMMARALHEFTSKLPLVEPRVLEPGQYVGRNTREAIEVGIQCAVYGAVELFVWNLGERLTRKPIVFVTGGGSAFVRGLHLVAELEDYEIDPLLTLEGIRLAAEALP